MRARAQGSQPADFDPAAYPILARHFFDIEPRRAKDIAGAEVADPKRQHYEPVRRTCRQSVTAL
jgi:hypothetical protein